jgi:3',5'-cyclic-AMP phosphodiesterase
MIYSDMKKIDILIILLTAVTGFFLDAQVNPTEDFNFIFMTDIHLEYGLNAPEGFQKAIDTANKLDADFVLTGGDMIADALGARVSRADSLYTLYVESEKQLNKPVYHTIGNHELLGIYSASGVDKGHPDYNDGMYKRYFGNPYYSFDHKGWHFIVLKSMVDAGDKYIGYIDDEQIEWLKKDLEKTDPETPIIISTHIPFMSTYGQLTKGALAPNDEALIVNNSREILQMLQKYNLKMVIQGHLHFIEYVYVQNRIRFLVGGAVSARWWTGPLAGMEEGFMHIHIRGNEIEWDYIDYGWEVKND